MAIPPKWYQFLVCVFASLGSFLYGYDLGVIAEVVASGSFMSLFKPDDTQKQVQLHCDVIAYLTVSRGLVVSMFTTGAFFGAGTGGPSGDFLGRRWTIAVGSLVFCLGGALQTGAENIKYLWGGRFIAGFGVGLLVMIIPPYQAELAHPDIRGRVTALQQFMLGVGALCAGWISYGTFAGFPDSNSSQWRVSLGLQIVPAIFLGLLIMLFPESPRWLIDHGREQKGLEVLAKLHAHGDVDDTWVRAEYNQIQESITYEYEHEAKSYLELFKSRSSFRRLLICCALQASIQMTGVSTIQYYSVTVYGQIGISDLDTLKYQAINNIIALIAQFTCILFIDRFGRRWPLILGNLGNCLTFIIATILIARFPPAVSNDRGAQWGFIIITWIYNFSFSATCGPLSWIIPAEVFDTRTRSMGVSIATMISFAFNTMIGQVTPIAFTNIGWHFYLVFLICNFTNALFFWAFLPETARRPLEEMNYLFAHAPYWVPGSRRQDYVAGDIERKLEEIQAKRNVSELDGANVVREKGLEASAPSR